MEPQTLNVETRDGRGKGAARQLRQAGKVPGIFYGPGAPTTSIEVAPKELEHLLMGEYRRNTLLKVTIDGAEHLALVKDLQVHPVTRAIRHVDLYKVSLDKAVEVHVPFSTSGRSKGVVAGGEMNVIFRELPISASPDKVPVGIDVDVTEMELDDFIKVKDLTLPEGVRVRLAADRNLVAVAAARRQAEEEEEAEEESAEAEPAAAS